MSEVKFKEEKETEPKAGSSRMVMVRPCTPHPWLILSVLKKPEDTDSAPASEVSTPEKVKSPAPVVGNPVLTKEWAIEKYPKMKSEAPTAAKPFTNWTPLPPTTEESPTEKDVGCCGFYNFP